MAIRPELAIMHDAHGRHEGRTCGECLYLVFDRRKFVPATGAEVNLRVCRQYPERLFKTKRPTFAMKWPACGAFKPVI